MLKETLKYTDFDGNEREEDFYFNFTKAELMQMELSVEGGFHSFIDSIMRAQNVTELIRVFKDLIDRSYGVKSPDGRRFIKNPEVLADFASTEAYSDLFMKLATDTNAASRFVNGIFPASLQAGVAQETAKRQGVLPGPGSK